MKWVELSTPCYVIEEGLIGEYLCSATASGLYEARLCSEEMCRPLAASGRKPENHIFSPAYRQEDFEEIPEYCDHIVFNSWKQVEKFGQRAKTVGKNIGLRINPECSAQKGPAIYDPCAPGSRLGVTKKEFTESGENPFHLRGEKTVRRRDGLRRIVSRRT